MRGDGEYHAQQHDQHKGQTHPDNRSNDQTQPADRGSFGEQEASQVPVTHAEYYDQPQ
jgi:hypothetical protein